jgi:hypothetical protein
MDHNQRWSLENKLLTSSTNDVSETPIWYHPPLTPPTTDSPQKTTFWWVKYHKQSPSEDPDDTDGSSHCKLTIWQASFQHTQHCNAVSKNSDSTQQSMSLMKHQDAVSATMDWQHPKIKPITVAPETRRRLSNKQLTASIEKVWQQHHKWANLVNLNKTKTRLQQHKTEAPLKPEGRTFSTAKFKHFW